MNRAQLAYERLARPDVSVVAHPLGFACVPIRPGLCVHAWLPDEPELKIRLAMSGIHRHSWDLDSQVLTGILGNSVHEVTPAFRDDATGRLYRIDTSPDGDTVTATGRYVRASLGHVDRYGPGDVYRLPAGAFHATYAVGVTVTLLAATDRGGRDVSVGPLRAPTEPRKVPRMPTSPRLAEHVIRLIRQHLEAAALTEREAS